MLRGVQCRLYPTAEQREFFARSFGCVRFVYNEALAYCQAEREAQRKHPNAIDLQKRLVSLKGQYPWLADVDSQALKESCRDLDKAFAAFFRRVKAGQTPGYPRFKSRNDRANSYTATQRLHADFCDRRIKLPKCGWVKCRGLRKFDGKIKSITVRQSASGRYTASLLIEDGHAEPLPTALPAGVAVTGIDMGCKTEGDRQQLATLSTGQVIMMPAYLKGALKRLARAQRKLARKTKGSNNRRKQRQLVARLHERVANQRRDFLHQTTHRLTRENQALAVEDLNVKGMMASPRPKQDEQGGYLPNGRAAKRGLARSLTNVGLGEFARQLRYKALWRGVALLECGRFEPSSKTCSGCGHRLAELPLAVRAWVCPECGAEHDRDVNAAINIRNFAIMAVGAGSPELKLPERGTAA
ncbi:RNA-guided endonuclease TnpB family protein [Aeromonas sp. ARM81]|uniref:RNA-guided endonuclease InsQ/TnpB family protein n=1 Tax=Aeromonas sp. ARM81 TaxID=1747384 RepID=UPI00090CCE0C|nr:RNA-guided endonuclease TnpB family protein [Aeromonas sp. ARM81]ALN97547.1 transposase [Aeromonas phage phiARM81ld]